MIAFRGTDFDQRGDWLSSLRWFVAWPVFDQYDQVKKAVRRIVDRLEASSCRPRRIYATGHSLGGGLAQQVAFADNRIDYVYAFDPSPVTGFFDLSTRTELNDRLGIDRIYEAGEVLSLPRYLASGVFATSPCQPRIRIVRFATLNAPGLINRHRIGNMVKGLTGLSSGPKPPRVLDGVQRARNCDFTGSDPEMR